MFRPSPMLHNHGTTRPALRAALPPMRRLRPFTPNLAVDVELPAPRFQIPPSTWTSLLLDSSSGVAAMVAFTEPLLHPPLSPAAAVLYQGGCVAARVPKLPQPSRGIEKRVWEDWHTRVPAVDGVPKRIRSTESKHDGKVNVWFLFCRSSFFDKTSVHIFSFTDLILSSQFL